MRRADGTDSFRSGIDRDNGGLMLDLRYDRDNGGLMLDLRIDRELLNTVTEK